MKKKRIFTRVLMVCLLLCTMCVPVLGAEEDSKGLEQAIVAAKKVITVPDNYTDFSNYSNERETIEGKIRVWRLNWSEKDKKEGYVSATIGENGVLYEYNRYNGDMNKNETGLAQVTKENAQASAEEFLKRIIPVDAGQMKIIDQNSDNYSREEYYFAYKKFVNEVPVNFVTAYIGINKYSGEVTSYNGDNSEIKGLEYPTIDGVMESSAAEKAYTEKLGVNLKYYSYYDYNQKKMNIFAGYSINDNRNNAIDAKTGQVVLISDEDRIYKDKMDSKSGNALDVSSIKAEQELTKEEEEAINKVSNLITKEKAENILRETFDIKTSDIKVNHASLNKKRTNENYVWDISFDGASGQVDAQSGEVISMYYYNDKDKDVANKNLSKADSKNIAEDFLKKIIPDKFAQTKYQEDKNTNLKISVGVDVEGDIYNFNFIRQVNGIEFSSNSLNIEIDRTKGKIVGYDNNWYENVDFPSVDKSMTKEDAFNRIKALSGFGLQYIVLDKNKIGLVYNFKNINENYIIDPLNGTRLDYKGQAYKENKLPEYKDISGHWCEKTVKVLLNNGYYIDGENFNPDMNITQIKFFKYIYSRMQNNYTDDEFYDMLIQNGVIKKEEKAPDSLISNQDVAKFVVRYLGYDKLAMHPEIFTNQFKDNIEEKYKGYASVCYGLNIIKGDQNGNFNGSHNITNAEAANILYNLISVGAKS
jgi:hypothetical protein